LTQEGLVDRMKTKQSVITRLESGHVMPIPKTLEKIAKAAGSSLKISFEPDIGLKYVVENSSIHTQPH